MAEKAGHHKTLILRIAITWLCIFLLVSFLIAIKSATDPITMSIIPEVPREGEPMSPRGGKREGAGRKPLDSEKRRQITVWLPAEALRQLDAARGDEPRSHRIARLVRAWLESQPG